MGIRLAVKEWAGVIEALNRGVQTVLIRKYLPEQTEFLLYPTYSYYTANKNHPDRFAEKFRPEFVSMARDSALEELLAPDLVKLKYVFKVENVIHLDSKAKITAAAMQTIWTTEHVQSYAEKSKYGVVAWVGQTKRLPSVVLAARQTTGGSITKYNHYDDVDVSESEPVSSAEHHKEQIAKFYSCIDRASARTNNK
ncbi:hypothetical protein BH10CYA1_BH10CYA1_62070 [soil metagenome]